MNKLKTILIRNQIIFPGEVIGFSSADSNIIKAQLDAYENDEELFSIIIKSNDYEPKFHYLDTLIFSRQKKINFEELHKKYCLVEYENKKYIKNIEYINDIIILKALNGKEETMVFPKGTYYNLRILGVLKGCLQKY